MLHMDPNEPVAVQEEISDSDSGQAMSTHGGLGGVGAGPLERDTDRLLSNSTGVDCCACRVCRAELCSRPVQWF